MGSRFHITERVPTPTGLWARKLRALGVAVTAYLFLTCATGCLSNWPSDWNPFNQTPPPPPPAAPADQLVLTGGKLEPDTRANTGKTAEELQSAKRLYDLGKYPEARAIFAGIAANTKAPVLIAEEACYYEADCLRLEGSYPDAGSTYNKLLTVYPSPRFGNLARRHMFDIANYWLDATRDEMRAHHEQMEGKRWLVMPAPFFNFDKTKPLTDMEGHAIHLLEQIYITDDRGPLADKALFLVANVHFYREDYAAAEHYYSELVKKCSRSEHATESLELSIICKQLSTGGPQYDTRKAAEARDLVNQAQTMYPKYAAEHKEWLTQQIQQISLQQAEKDFQFAEFYERTGHPASAYFYYEIVRRRYHGSQYADKASVRMNALRAELDHKQQTAPAQEAPNRANPNAQMGPLPPSLAPGVPLMQGGVPGTLPPSLQGPR